MIKTTKAAVDDFQKLALLRTAALTMRFALRVLPIITTESACVHIGSRCMFAAWD